MRIQGAADGLESYYHITDNPKFHPDPDKVPEDNSITLSRILGPERKGLYVTKNPEHWISGHGYHRPYMAEIHAHPDHVDGGEYGGEGVIPAHHFDKIKVHRVIPADAWGREEYGSHGLQEGHHGTTFDTNEPIKPTHYGNWHDHYPFRYNSEGKATEGYHYDGPDVRDMPKRDTNRHKRRWLKFMQEHQGWSKEDTAELGKQSTIGEPPIDSSLCLYCHKPIKGATDGECPKSTDGNHTPISISDKETQGMGKENGPRAITALFVQAHDGLTYLAHGTSESAVVMHCFAGETTYLTRQGVRTFAETVGTTQEVLTNQGYDRVSGYWVPAQIRAFGQQQLWKVVLQRNKQIKVVHATAEHRWFVTSGKSRDEHRIVQTQDLCPRDRLSYLKAAFQDVGVDHEAVRYGFVFGDGNITERQLVESSTTYGHVRLWGAKMDLAPFFDEIAVSSTPMVTPNGVPGLDFSSGMKGYNKELPSLDRPLEYLRSWLMGYFAADGSVYATGQMTISSSVLGNLLHVRDICTLLGIRTFSPTDHWRTGYGSEPSLIFEMGFVRADFTADFFLRDDQRRRFTPTGLTRFGWTVQNVTRTDRIEEVYCATVPGTESFVLEDNIWIPNCPFDGAGTVVGRSDGSIECGFCFSGETTYITWDGVKTLKETVGTTQLVLSSTGAALAQITKGKWALGHSPFGGKWIEAEIKSFGVQPLLKVTLYRNDHRNTKVVHATAEHRWWVNERSREGYKQDHKRVVLTEALQAGDRLVALFPRGRLTVGRPTVPSPFGVAHGFVYGDGSLVTHNGGSEVTLWGEKDQALSPYFGMSNKVPYVNENGTRGENIHSLPAFFKDRPPRSESLSYLYGWLAGYFAADGSVGEKGNPNLSSADRDNLEFVRMLCAQLGIGTYDIGQGRAGSFAKGEGESLWKLPLVASTLTPEFFIIPEHRRRFESRVGVLESIGWTVMSVEATDRVEEVFCAVVPGDENFTLEDNINVLNCGNIFTVQLQPQFSSTPQSIGGEAQPGFQNSLDMPGDTSGEPVEDEEGAPEDGEEEEDPEEGGGGGGMPFGASLHRADTSEDWKSIKGLEFRHAPLYVKAYTPESLAKKQSAAHLVWYRNGEINSLSVHPDHQRMGLATELLRRAREINPNVHHSPVRSPNGDAWAKSTGEDLPTNTADPANWPKQSSRIYRTAMGTLTEDEMINKIAIEVDPDNLIEVWALNHAR